MKTKNLFILLLAIFLLNSCAYNKIEPVQPIVQPISFSKNIIPILEQNCSTANCHTGLYPAVGLNLDASVAYQVLTNPRKGYTDTLNPKLSVLYGSLTSLYQPMPPSPNSRLTENQINQIVAWMKQGAKNN